MNTGVQRFETLVPRIGRAASFSLLVLLLTAVPTQAEGWRDIEPLHSTRADVERLLGRPVRDWMGIYFYEFEAERVKVFFAEGPCGVGSSNWNVPRDTVVSISVTPKPNLLKLADLKLGDSKFKKEEDREVGGVVRYVSEENGITYEVDTSHDNVVTLVHYHPTIKESHLRCPSSGGVLNGTTRIDSYSEIPFWNEKRRLGNFAEQLRRYTTSEGYIISYAGRRARVGQARERAKKAKTYLIRTHRINPKRIVVIDGGHREEVSVELYLVPPGATPPPSTPTVDHKEVQIIPTRRRRK